MFSNLRRLFGSIKVTQTDKNILVEGVDATTMENDIAKIWKTSKICTNMFTHISRHSFSFPLFFAPDIIYALEVMIEHRGTNSNIKTLNNIKEKIYESTWMFDTREEVSDRLDFSKLNDITYTLLPFQMEFLKYYSKVINQYNLNGALLAGAAGSGKTLTGLALAHCLHAETIIVICPKNAVNRVWEANIHEVFKKPQTYWLAQDGKNYSGERILVAHYETLEKVIALVPNIKNGKIVIILDESHNLNEVSSQRTQSFINLCKLTKSTDIVLASGTPIKALGSESIPLFRTIDPYFTDDAEQRFRKIYGKDANKGLDILKNRLGIVSFKIEKKELNLLPPIMKNISISMPNAQNYTLAAISTDMKKYTAERLQYFAGRKKEDEKTFYNILDSYRSSIDSAKLSISEKNELISDFNTYKTFLNVVIKAYNDGDLRNAKEEIMFCNQFENKKIIPFLSNDAKVRFKEVKTVVKYVGLKIQGECLGRVLGRKRIQCHVDMIPFIDFQGICNSTLKKTIVFTSFVEALEECNRFLKDKEMDPLVVYGKTNNELADTVKRFESDESLNPLIATYNSLSTAVPLVMSDTMIMLNAPFRAYIQEQAISRIHRLGATTQTCVYMVNLDTGKEPNISTRSIDILAWSQAQVTAIMGIVSPFEISESMENMTVTVAAESYDISEVVTLKDVAEVTVKDKLLTW